MEDKKPEKHIQEHGKWIVDSLFDKKLFVDTLTRDDLNYLEDYIATSMDLEIKNVVGAKLLLHKWKIK